MFENYNIPLVFLSFGIALLASYTAIDLALRMNSATGSVKKLWHACGSISLGIGVWGMHFIGMLAFKLPVSVTYDIFLTFISFLPAFLASTVVLWVISRSDTRWPVLLPSSVIMGVGISSMHYVGMLAMQIAPAVKYDLLWLILSFVVAIVVSFVAMWIICRLDLNKDRLRNTGVKLVCAMSMAAAISGMHYTGMSAAIFSPEIVVLAGFGLGGDWLATLVGVGVVMVLLSFSIAAIVDSRFADHNVQMANKLQEVNRKLIVHANSLAQTMVEKEAALSAVSVVNDELAQAKEQAERSSAELAGYLEAIDQHALISVTDNKGNIVRVNEKFIQVSGYQREELLGQNHRIVNSGAHPKAFFVEMWRILSRGDIWRNEICNRAKDGSLYWIDTAIVPLKDDHGKIIRYISVRVNVTRYKEIESKLLQTMDAAGAANEAKSRFLANMSHEIRTPMNSILGMAHLLRRSEMNDQQLGYIANIQRSSEHLLTIINDVLDLSKIEAGKIQVIAQDFDLQEVLDDVSSQCSYQLNDKDIAFTFDVSLDISRPFCGDSLRLSQILLNYVSNAIKFTEKGKIVVSVQLVEEDNAGCLVKFNVRDTGIGIDEEKIKALFKPFNQVDSSSTRKYGGTGLGLAVSKELAELMGGEVGVESQLGVGSDFWFTVRLSRGVKAVARRTAAVRSLDGTNQLQALRILVVEDDELNQQVAIDFLEYNGAIVEVAQNGKEAIDILRSNQRGFDCVLMDMQMPVMDGLEATKIIRSDIKLANMPVIAMTANADQKSRQLCFDAGMNDFITKPIDPNFLISTLLRWLKSDLTQAKSSHVMDLDVVEMSDTDTLIDLSVLAVSLGQNDLVKIHKFFLLFVESTKDSMKELEVALTNADLMCAAALGHRLKSAALTVGALSFAELCKELESFKNGGEIERAREILQQMQLLLVAIEKQLELILSKSIDDIL